eukprot:g711.t1
MLQRHVHTASIKPPKKQKRSSRHGKKGYFKNSFCKKIEKIEYPAFRDCATSGKKHSTSTDYLPTTLHDKWNTVGSSFGKGERFKNNDRSFHSSGGRLAYTVSLDKGNANTIASSVRMSSRKAQITNQLLFSDMQRRQRFPTTSRKSLTPGPGTYSLKASQYWKKGPSLASPTTVKGIVGKAYDIPLPHDDTQDNNSIHTHDNSTNSNRENIAFMENRDTVDYRSEDKEVKEQEQRSSHDHQKRSRKTKIKKYVVNETKSQKQNDILQPSDFFEIRNFHSNKAKDDSQNQPTVYDKMNVMLPDDRLHEDFIRKGTGSRLGERIHRLRDNSGKAVIRRGENVRGGISASVVHETIMNYYGRCEPLEAPFRLRRYNDDDVNGDYSGEDAEDEDEYYDEDEY